MLADAFDGLFFGHSIAAVALNVTSADAETTSNALTFTPNPALTDAASFTAASTPSSASNETSTSPSNGFVLYHWIFLSDSFTKPTFRCPFTSAVAVASPEMVPDAL